MLGIGALPGSLISGFLMTWIGQRKVLLLAIPLKLLGWMGKAFAYNLLTLQLSRLLLGFSHGLVTGTIYSYIIEITHGSLRGRMSALVDISRQLGMLYVFAIGSTSLNWREIAIVCAVTTTVIPFTGLFFIHDSPRWLVCKGKKYDAEKSLKFYRGEKYDVKSELSNIIDLQNNSLKSNAKFKDEFKLLFNKVNLKILGIISSLLFIFLFTGDNVIVNYAAVIFQSINPKFNEDMCSIIIGSINVIATITYTFLSDKFSRKLLCMISLLISATFLFSLSLYLYLVKIGIDLTPISWMPVLILSIVSFLCNIVKPIMYLYSGELLPNSIRSLGSGIVNFSYSSAYFLSVFTYPMFISYLGTHGTFGFYGICCISLALVCYNHVPETKDTSLEDIEKHLKLKTKN